MIFKPKSVDPSTLCSESCNHSLPVSGLGPSVSGAAGDDNLGDSQVFAATSVPGLSFSAEANPPLPRAHREISFPWAGSKPDSQWAPLAAHSQPGQILAVSFIQPHP